MLMVILTLSIAGKLILWYGSQKRNGIGIRKPERLEE
jgi:hypothetical protein